MRLVFQDLSIEIELLGFSQEVATGLARSWVCQLEPGVGRGESFLFELIPDPTISYREEALRETLHQGTAHHRRAGNEDQLLLPGARVRVWPDRPVARIEVHPDLLSNHDLLQLAARMALPRALAHLSAACVHAAAFELEGTAILAVGASGVGKSTLAAAAIAGGGRVVSDDSLILGQRTDGSVVVRPSRPHLLFRDPTPDLFDGEIRSQLLRWESAGVDRWCLSPESVPSAFVPTLSPQIVLFLHRDPSRQHHQLGKQIQSHALSELLAANISSYQMGPGYEEELQQLTELFGALLSECSISRLDLAEVSNLQQGLEAGKLARLLESR